MRIRVFCILAFSIAALTALSQSTANGHRIEYRQLTWKDYKVVDKGTFSAYTPCGLSWHGKWKWRKSDNGYTAFIADIQPYAFMNPDAAYVLKNATPTLRLLRHEQGHFDICELFARRLRAQNLPKDAWTQTAPTSDAAIAALRAAVDKYFNQQTQLFLKASRQYDQETHHGQDAKQQARWTQSIDTQLKATAGV